MTVLNHVINDANLIENRVGNRHVTTTDVRYQKPVYHSLVPENWYQFPGTSFWYTGFW